MAGYELEFNMELDNCTIEQVADILKDFPSSARISGLSVSVPAEDMPEITGVDLNQFDYDEEEDD